MPDQNNTINKTGTELGMDNSIYFLGRIRNRIAMRFYGMHSWPVDVCGI